MRYRQLGQSGITVSAVAMGCWALAGGRLWGEQDESDSIATVHAALDAGVNFFDTAEGYGGGRSEAVLGKALAGRRERAVIATKVSAAHLSRQGVQAACEASLRRLGTDYIDLYQIHWPNWDVPVAETMGALEGLRSQGKVRTIGVCNHGVRDLTDLLAVGRCETNQLPYSLLWRGIEFEVQPACLESGVGILCYSPLAQGLLTGKFATAEDVPEGRARIRLFSGDRPGTRHHSPGYEAEVFAAIDRVRAISAEVDAPMAVVALAWALQQPGVTAILAGARRPEQIRQNARAAGLKLPADVLAALSRATDEVKEKLGADLDQYQIPSRFR